MLLLVQALLTIAAFCYFGHQAKKEREALIDRYAKERESLLDRIQHPEIVRVQEVSTEVVPDDDTTREILQLVKGD